MSERQNMLRASPPSGLLTGITRKLDELEEAVHRQADRFAAVLEIGTAITAVRDVDGLLRLVIDRLSALLEAEACTLFMLDAQRQELWSRVLRGPRLLEIRVPADKGIIGQAVMTGSTVSLADAYQDARFNPDIDRQSGYQTHSIIAAPLKHVSGRILGCVEVLDHRVNAFTADDVMLVETVAAQVAGVLDNVLLYEQLRAQKERLELLYEVERAVSSAQGQEALLDQILAKATSLLGAPIGAVLLSDPNGAASFRSYGEGVAEKAREAILREGRAFASKVIQTGKPLRLSAEQARESIKAQRSAPPTHPLTPVDLERNLAAGAVQCVPIPGEDHILGALLLLDKPDGFTENDEQLATLLAGQTGRAILLRHAREEGERRARLESIGQLLSSVLHDLRTPMTVISGYAQLMAQGTSESERRQYSEVIERQVEHINAMTRETLAFARGERALLLRYVQMFRFTSDVKEFLTQDFAHSNVALEIRERYSGPARVDENKLKRLVYNIARNSAQAMPDGGKFILTLERQGDELVLRFEDNGPGIPTEIADRLFQSFVTAGKAGGTGLGLAIVKKIAEEHGGTVGFTSAPGKGTTFEVRLPVGTPAVAP